MSRPLGRSHPQRFQTRLQQVVRRFVTRCLEGRNDGGVDLVHQPRVPAIVSTPVMIIL